VSCGSIGVAVVMTAWRRPYYLQETLASWAAADGIGDVPFTVALDPSDRQHKMLTVIRDAGFAAEVNPVRLGVLVNPAEAISRAFRKDPGTGFVVCAEEDVIVSRDILAYFTWAAAEFAADRRVLAVCAHSNHEGTDPAAVDLRQEFSALVWGTWRDRWDTVLEPTWDRDYSSGDTECPSSGWDWNLIARIIPRGRFLTVVPDQTRSQHIGEHEGIHCSAAQYREFLLASFEAGQEPVPYQVRSSVPLPA
jgi:hypothetical protein